MGLFLLYFERRILMEDSMKEVYFEQYCKTCRYEKTAEHEDPCDECLNSPTNVYSHKPIKYEKRER